MKKVGIVLCLVILVSIGILNSVFADPWDELHEGNRDTQFGSAGVQCVSGQNSASWINVTDEGGLLQNETLSVVFDSSGQVGSCSEWNSVSNLTCCPQDHQCNMVTGNCTRIVDDFCEKYTTKATCNESNMVSGDNPAEKFFKYIGDEWLLNGTTMPIFEAKCGVNSDPYIKNGEICTNFSDCLCFWDGQDCLADWKDSQVCNNNPPTSPGHCTYKLIETKNECDTAGKITMIYNVSADPPSYKGCTIPSDRVVSCSAVTVVPFFSFMNVILSVLGIVGVYFFYRKTMVHNL